jgi:hypothetical protein
LTYRYTVDRVTTTKQVLKGANKMKNKINPIECARSARRDTISELGTLIFQLQKDYDRLKKAKDEDDLEGLTPQLGNTGYYLSQHCLNYEQTVKAGTKMELWASIAQWEEA